MMASGRRRIAVIGGGITGLAAANRLLAADPTRVVTVYEASSRLGGHIQTDHVDGFTIEAGPDAFLANKPRGTGLGEELGMDADFVAPDQSRRGSFILRDGALHRMPDGLTGLIPTRLRPILETRLISPQGKARMALDLVLPSRKTEEDESLASFLSRRLGSDAANNLIEPLMAGIYAGDSAQLSLLATFPQLRKAEREHGGLIRGMIANRRASERGSANPVRTGFLSFQSGMGAMVDALAARIRGYGGEIRTGATVTAITPRQDGGFDLGIESDGSPSIEHVDAMILATPAWAAAPLLAPIDGDVSRALAEIPYVSTALVALAFDARALSKPDALHGFGYVVPRREQRDVMAMTWLSSKWRGRAPEGKVLIRGFVGRSGQEALFAKSDAELIAIVGREAREVMGITGEPELSRVYRHERGMPQYNLGHLDRVRRIEAGMTHIPGIEIAGNMFRGVGIPDAILSGESATDRIIDKYSTVSAVDQGQMQSAS